MGMNFRITRALVVCALAVTVAGCAGGATPSPSGVVTERTVFSGTRTEYIKAVAVCMQNKGIKAQFIVDGEGEPGVETNDPNATGKDDDPAQAAWNDCVKELPATPEAKSDADFKVMYDNLIVQTKCVQREGYEAPPVPSWQSFVEDARAQDLDWDPTIRVPVQLRSTVRKICVDHDKWW